MSISPLGKRHLAHYKFYILGGIATYFSDPDDGTDWRDSRWMANRNDLPLYTWEASYFPEDYAKDFD